jgi:tRNA (guanosine-2'-O-)-methyltransferase
MLIKNLKKIKKQTAYLAEFMLDSRCERIEEVLQQRMRYLTVVLEDIYHAPNASAVIRSCECFGIQDLHVIENTKRYKPNADVVRGSAKWIDMHRYRTKVNGQPGAVLRHSSCPTKEDNNTATCISSLKENGFKIVATTLQDDKALTPEELPLTSPLALCFGTEELGLSDQVYDMADYTLKIPMYGFTESFNISVAVALCLQTLTAKLHNSQISWQLSDDEKTELRFAWYKKSVKNAGKILERAMK